MPSDPQHPMDPPLRSYARKRREDAGESSALHPATRAMLRAEAAKLHAPHAAARRSLWGWLAAYWPRLAFASAVCMALAVTAWKLLPEREPMAPAQTMARLDESKDRLAEKEVLAKSLAEQRSEQARPAPAALSVEPQRLGMKAEDAPAKPESRVPKLRAPSSDRRLALTDVDGAGIAESLIVGQRIQTNFTAPLAADPLGPRGTVAFGATLAPAPATNAVFFGLPAGASTPAEMAGGPAPSGRYSQIGPPPIAPALVAAPAPVSTPPIAEPMARFRAAADTSSATALSRRPQPPAEAAITLKQAGKRLRYQRSENAARGVVTAVPLAFFDFEQNGQAVRLIEANGSIYEGVLAATNTASFRVHGTNRVSRKAMTVEGEFLGEETAAGATADRYASPRGAPSRSVLETKAPAAKTATGLASVSPQSNSPAAGRLLLRIRTEGAPEIRSIAVPAAK